MGVMGMGNGEVPAFPGNGLTKRELIAAMVFQQLLHGAVLPEGFDATSQLRAAAARAIESADALLAELAKEHP